MKSKNVDKFLDDYKRFGIMTFKIVVACFAFIGSLISFLLLIIILSDKGEPITAGIGLMNLWIYTFNTLMYGTIFYLVFKFFRTTWKKNKLKKRKKK
jgi:phosphotransferase system  glucose/maltose/N-acetylglucosamine-specific IIC component